MRSLDCALEPGKEEVNNLYESRRDGLVDEDVDPEVSERISGGDIEENGKNFF